MKNSPILILISLVFSLLFTGCANTGGTAAAPEIAQLVAQTVITNTVPAVLNRNPAYEVKLLLLVDGVDIIFAKGTVTPEQVNAYLDALNVDPETRLILGSAILDLWNIYSKTAGVKIGSVSDPRFVGLLTSFKDGIREGIRRYHIFKPGAVMASVPTAAK